MLSGTLFAQTIPDFNTNFGKKVPVEATVNAENTILSTNLAPVPKELKEDIKLLMSVDGDLSISAAPEYSKVTQQKIKELEKRRDCLKISEEKTTDPCAIPLSKFNDVMAKNSDSIRRYKALNDYFIKVEKLRTVIPITYTPAELGNTYDKGAILVPIPPYLQADMKNLMNINSTELDAYASYSLWKDADRKIKELQDSQNCAKLLVDGKDKNDPCFIPREHFNEEMKKYSDSIKRYSQLRSFFKTANKLGGTPKLSFGKLLPVKNIMSAKYFFLYNNDEENIMFINKVGIQSNFSNSFSANADVVSGVLYITKFKMATNISQQTSETDSIAATKLMNGGLLNMSVTVPILFSKYYIGNGKSFVLYAPVEYRFNIDDVKDKVEFNSTYNYHEVSGYIMATIDLLQKESVKDEATLFGALKHSYFTGGSQFESKITDNKFWLTQLTLGIKIKDKYTFSANIPLHSTSDIVKRKQVATFGITFEPGN